MKTTTTFPGLRSLCGAILLAASAGAADAQAPTTTISSNFNGTSIAGGRYILFNAHLTSLSWSSEATNAAEVTLFMKNIKATFTAGGTPYVVQLPDSDMKFSTGVTSASGSYVNSKWSMTFPKEASGSPLVSALMWPVPAAGIPGGTNPVTMSMDVYTSVNNISKLSWQWSAAVYTTAPSDPNSLGILFEDGARSSGTPMNYRSYVVGGARGGGGSNFTGSWSATGSINGAKAAVTPPTGSLKISRNVLVQGSIIPVGYSIDRK